MVRGAGKFVFASCLAAACVSHVDAAEWSFAPSLTWLTDHNSNRTLREHAIAGESLGALVDADIVRRSENSAFTLRPHYRLQRYPDGEQPDLDDRELSAFARWQLESSMLDISARAAQESTLTT
jgi:hypothetical protein